MSYFCAKRRIVSEVPRKKVNIGNDFNVKNQSRIKYLSKLLKKLENVLKKDVWFTHIH